MYSTYIYYLLLSLFDYPCTNRPYSSMLGKAQGTEIFRNMENFEKVKVK